MNAYKTNEFILASILSSYPDERYASDIKTLLDEEMTVLSPRLRSNILDIIKSEEKTNDLRSEYLALFDSGRGVAPLYETEYGRQRAIFKANELSAIAGFYKAFGFELGGEDSAREMPDHLSVELEFYALLLIKLAALEESKDWEGIEIVTSARKKFMKDHLGRFVPAILERPGITESETYNDILNYCDNLIKTECLELEIMPEKANWIEGEQETSEVCCGVGVKDLK